MQIRPRLKRLREEKQVREISDRIEKRLEEIEDLSGADRQRLEKIDGDEFCVAVSTDDGGEPGGILLNKWTTSLSQQDSMAIEIGTRPNVDIL